METNLYFHSHEQHVAPLKKNAPQILRLNRLADNFCRYDMRSRLEIREDDKVKGLFYIGIDNAERGRGLSFKEAMYYILGVCHAFGMELF